MTNLFPLGLKGPFSENAPTPTEEQPGPFIVIEKEKNERDKGKVRT